MNANHRVRPLPVSRPDHRHTIGDRLIVSVARPLPLYPSTYSDGRSRLASRPPARQTATCGPGRVGGHGVVAAASAARACFKSALVRGDRQVQSLIPWPQAVRRTAVRVHWRRIGIPKFSPPVSIAPRTRTQLAERALQGRDVDLVVLQRVQQLGRDRTAPTGTH